MKVAIPNAVTRAFNGKAPQEFTLFEFDLLLFQGFQQGNLLAQHLHEFRARLIVFGMLLVLQTRMGGFELQVFAIEAAQAQGQGHLKYKNHQTVGSLLRTVGR